MRLQHQTYQAIDLKELFIILTLVLCVFHPIPALAQTTPAGLDGAQIMELANGGNLTGAASALSTQSQIPLGSAAQLLQSLQSGGNIDVGASTDVVNGLLGGQIPADTIGTLGNALQNLQNGTLDPGTISSLVQEMAAGDISPAVTQALSAIPNLGDLQGLAGINQIFQNPAVAQGLQDMLANAGLPAEVTDAISQIAAIGLNTQSLQQMGAELAAQAIAQAIQQVSPQLAQALAGLLGGPEGLTSAIAGLLGGGTGGGGGSGGGGSGSGGQCGAACNDCADCPEKINNNHQIIRAHVTSEFEQHRNWILTTFFKENILSAMMLMAEHLTSNGMQQVQIIGSFFDVKHQLETQRIFQTLTARAHKDYHPSEGLCRIGTNVRGLATAERKSNLAHVAFANRMMDRQTLQSDTMAGGVIGDDLTSFGGTRDRKTRMNNFIKKFCDKTDHAGGLGLLCKDSNIKAEQRNMDIDFTGAFESKLTLDVDFTDAGAGPATIDEDNLFALSTNLFGNEILPSINGNLLINPVTGKPSDLAQQYLGLRSVAAKRSVAQNSFAAITAMKSQGGEDVGPFLKAILAESGVSATDIERRLGKNPSYFAQMEVLTKDLYQNPNFYSNLYDKPVNIERKGAALQAIELMQDRDLYRSLLRSEAVLATLLETLMRKEHDRISGDLGSIPKFSEQRRGGT